MRSQPAICHINLAKHFHGGERQTELLIFELARAGWMQRLVVREGHELVRRLASIKSLEIIEVSPNPLAAAFAARGAILLHAHEARGVYSGLLANILFRIPFVFTRRVVNPQRSSWFREQAYRRAGAVVAVSEAAAREMKKAHPGVQPRVITDAHADLPAVAGAVDAIRERFPGKRLIGHIGTLADDTKGQRTLFAVARRAVVEHPDWQFLLLGDGADRGAFEEETKDLDNVHLEGFVDNVGDYLAAFDLFVFPSISEAVGSTLLDAMQAGLPIVASRTGGIPEIIEDGRNGLLVEPRDEAGFEQAIAAVLDDDELRARFVQANREDAKRYSASAMAEAYVAAYRSVIDAL